MQLQNPDDPTNEVPESAPQPAVEPETVPSAESDLPEAVATLTGDEEANTPPASEEFAASETTMTSDEEDDIPSASEEVHASEFQDGEDDSESESESASSEPGGIRRGNLIESTVLQKNENEVLVDLGNGVTGVIPARELQYLDPKMVETLAAGSQLFVYVLKAKSSTGMPVLSVSRALEEQDWREAEEYADNKAVYEGRVAGYNKGGLIVRFGRLRGFIPASQISQEREHRARGDSPDQRWSNMLNEAILVKVVEVNRQRNRLILSERAASREIREAQKQRLIDDLKVGDIRKGKVISLTDFGAFVDLGGADGLIHLTELSWKHVTHPRELLNVGDEVEVKVISIDSDRKRIGLSLKSLESDPWVEVMKAYSENQLVQGKITKLTRFGAFASLMDNVDVEGLIHVSELADYRVEHPRDVVAVGDVLTLRVIKIDVERRRLGLSLKRVNSSKYMNSDWNSWNPQ